MEEHGQWFDICIVCALAEEARAVIKEFSERCDNVHFQQAFSNRNRYEYQYAILTNNTEEPLTVLITYMPFTGPVETVNSVRSLLEEFRPRFIAMTGICAGYKEKVALGDLVAATYAFHYEEGKVEANEEGEDRFRPEWRTHGPTRQIVQYINNFTGWETAVAEMKQRMLGRELRQSERPKCLSAPVASGMAVQGNNPFPRLLEHNRKALFLDQEVAAFYQTLQEFPDLHFLAVKAVCDNGDPDKNDDYHEYAARASAIYLLSFLQKYVTNTTMPRRDTPAPSDRAGPPPLHSSLSPDAKNRYQSWLLANTATFHIPGPSGVSLPIETAWAELHVLSKQQVSQQLAQEMGTRPLQISAIVSNCLQFWHERGVLDRFHVGHQEVYTFVHATFNEYTAGRYLASLSLPEIQEWVRNKFHDVRWREVILLAAGCGAVEVIVETLLGIDAEDEQSIPALFLAAAVIADSPTAPGTLTQTVASRLTALLTSAHATLAYEAAEQGVSLVKRVPDLFTPLLQPLFEHSQEWTRFSAIYLALESKVRMIDADGLEELLDLLTSEDLLPRKRKAAFRDQGKVIFSVGWDLQNKLVVLSAEMLASIRPDAKTRRQLQALYDNNHAVSMGTHLELRRVLLDLGCEEFLGERDRREREKTKGGILDLLFSGKGSEADRKVLETLLRLTSSPLTSAKKRSKLRALAVLLFALHVLEAPIQDWYVLRKLDDIPAIEAVLSGYIAALGLDNEELAQDAAWALAELQKPNQDAMVRKSLLSLLPVFPISPEIHTITLSHVQVEHLIRALRHPSYIIVHGAAQLLAKAGEGRVEVASLLLTSNDERLLHILALIAGRLWAAEARPLLLKRLDQGFTSGSWWLIEELPYLQGEHTDQRFQQMLLRALHAEEPRKAIAAAHALQQLDISLIRDMVPALEVAHLYWMGQGEGAKAKSFYIADECPACHTEPGNAYAHVNHLLHQL